MTTNSTAVTDVNRNSTATAKTTKTTETTETTATTVTNPTESQQTVTQKDVSPKATTASATAPATAPDILQVSGLDTCFSKKNVDLRVIKNITFNLQKGRVLGVVGESGCGKSVLVNAIMNLLPRNGKISAGSIKFIDGDNPIELQSLKQYGKEFRSIRGDKISMIFQDPMAALNPVYSIGDQIIEVLREHYPMPKQQAYERAVAMLEKLGIKDAQSRIHDFPHQFSGGQRQRIMIAMAMINNPEIIIADEPTTALDVTIQAQILDLLNDLKNEYGSGVILITHDLGVVAQMADDVAVMYAGEIVELATAEQLFKNPKHPYTRSLLQSIPTQDHKGKKLHVIQGMVPPISELPEQGCRFAPRIPWIDQQAHEADPQLHHLGDGHYVRCSCWQHFHFQDDQLESYTKKKEFGPLVLEVNNLKKHYAPKKRLFRKAGKEVRALDNVSFKMFKGSTIGIIGESGCGKSTLAKSIMRLHEVTSGEININLSKGKQNIFALRGKDELEFRKKVQMVFQDPYSSLNPTKKIYESFDEPMRVHGLGSKEERYEIMLKCLKMVNLPEDYLYRYPHEFSGGQRQRISIARALCMSPEVIILDEPVSALDLSVQAQVLNYLLEIQRDQDLSYIFISHDLGVVKYMCDYIYIIQNGRFVETGTTDDIYNNPQHIYTKKLLASIPEIDINSRSSLASKRREIEMMFEAEKDKFYTADVGVFELSQLSDTHFVAVKPELVDQVKAEYNKQS